MIDPCTISALISVDPGCGVTAWALWRRSDLGGHPDSPWQLRTVGHLVRVERDGVVALRVRDVLEDLVPRARRDGPPTCALVVEDQWLGRRDEGASPHADVLALTRQRRTWEVCAELLGLAHDAVPSAWVGRVTKGLAPCQDHEGRRTPERRIVARGRMAWPGLLCGDDGREPTPDEWAAIQLGEYWLAERRQRVDRTRRAV